MRSYGLGADNILSVDIVLANGTLLHNVSNTGDCSDLFWATQGGGGGSFGIITAMNLRVHPAPQTMTSVQCYW